MRLPRRAFLAASLVVSLAVVVILALTLTGNDAPARSLPPGTLAGDAPRLPILTSAGATPSAGDLGDPYLLTVPASTRARARYILFGTGDWPANVPTAVSTDLHTWTRTADAMPVVPAWSASDRFHSHIWAPAVHKFGPRWLLYVTVPDNKSHRQCIAVETAKEPEGPYTDVLGHALVCQAALGGSIDASVAVTAQGPVLLWKSDGNCCHLPATLWSQALRADGLAVTGAAHPLLSATKAWQQGVMEEPAAVANPRGGFWLFYSGNFYNGPGYAIGIASCSTIYGPCIDRSDKPYAETVPGQRSPGGLEIFRDLQGKLRAVFDTWTRPTENGHYDCCRAIDLATLSGL